LQLPPPFNAVARKSLSRIPAGRQLIGVSLNRGGDFAGGPI
jgi:hypothetical protein